ncbi:ABC transporter substrate-binding protein [Pseudomonas sp. 1928-m]|uniref:substrate-binding periplasmic protein n=1 Tax=Pseudomonas sp. 1928-m TaxID=3033804 RepID=UPI0023DF9431|nr:ABC transporter substrate-binding protein [Pseudomonas sp. 1928-m]MDF3194861.1 ABC transporter substrate-binding protein [Pseudomonas sp. 1928-m]
MANAISSVYLALCDAIGWAICSSAQPLPRHSLPTANRNPLAAATVLKRCQYATSNLRRVSSLVGLNLVLMHGMASAQTIELSAADFLAPQVPAVEALLRKAGFEPAITLVPAARSLLMLQRGEVDAEFFRQPGAVASFREQVHLVGPLSCSTNYAFVHRDSRWVINTAEDLRDLRVGILNGNQLATDLLDKQGIQHDKLISRENMFLMLERGRLDIVIEPERSGLTSLQQKGLSKTLERRGPALTNLPNYLVLRKHVEQWGPRLDRAAAQALRSGQWHQWIEEINEQLGIPKHVGLGCLPKPDAELPDKRPTAP